MISTKHIWRHCCMMLIFTLLCACGQTGSLYLPDNPAKQTNPQTPDTNLNMDVDSPYATTSH